MKIQQYMVDAFTDKVFHGNQAAVCATEAPLSEELMQNITCENNYSETAFLVPLETTGEEDARFSLRWFTPGGEIDLCGHATLASAFVVATFLAPGTSLVLFETCSGEIPVTVEDGWITMNMPSFHLHQIPVTDAMEQAFGVRPLEAWLDRDLICVLPSEANVRAVTPDANLLLKLEGMGQCITAPSETPGVDFVSRFFAPELNVIEDPVCGSAHCALVPLWSEKLGKESFLAEQVSSRGGMLKCRKDGDRTIIAGRAALYAIAELHV